MGIRHLDATTHGARTRHLLLLLAALALHAPASAQTDRPADYTRTIGSARPILVDVTFSGNNSIAEIDLRSRITTSETTLSSLGKLARIARRGDIDKLARHIQRIAGSGINLRYLNTSTVEEDKEAIKGLYREFGFHQARVRAVFTFDTARSISTVEFDIDEGPQYKIWGIRIQGIDMVPADIRRTIEDLQFLSKGGPMRVVDIDLEVDRIFAHMRRVGYPFVREHRPPHVVVCKPPRCADHQDSIVLYIDPRGRYRVSNVRIIPSPRDTASHPEPVEAAVVLAQLEFRLEEWYDKDDIDRTRQNLYRLGIFDEVTMSPVVDTVGGSEELTIEIRYSMRDRNEIEGSLELSIIPRSDETVVTAGVSSQYTRLNMFRRGIIGSIGGRVQGRVPEFQEIEYSGTGRLDIPVTNLLRARFLSISGTASLGTADRAGNADLISERVAGAIDLTWSFPEFTWLSGATARILYQRNAYSNVADFIAERARLELSEADLPAECDTTGLTAEISQVLARNVYRLQVLQGDAPELRPSDEARDKASELQQTLIIGGTIISDSRDDFFSPSKGLYVEANGDVGITGGARPVGRFWRLEGDVRYFLPARKEDVWAFRGHGGIVFQEPGFPLTPLNNRFHAGGPNSIRGWGAREMLVTSPAEVIADPCADPIVSEIISDSRRLLGGLWLLEFSAEYRWKPSINWVIIPFIDAGNAYFRNYSDDLPLITAETIFKNIAVAAGMNFGFITPAGPVRFGAGFPIYNPIDDNTFAIQVSIGHAF